MEGYLNIKDRNTELSTIILRLSDLVIINLSFALAAFLVYLFFDQQPHITVIDWALYNIFWLFFSSLFGLYAPQSLSNTVILLRQSSKVVASFIVLYSLYFLFFSYFYSERRFRFLIFCLGLILLLNLISRLYVTYLIEFVAKKAKLNRRCAIIGNNKLGYSLASFFQENEHLYSFQGFLDKKVSIPVDSSVDYMAERIIHYALDNDINEIYTTLPLNPLTTDLFEMAENHCIKLRFVHPTHIAGDFYAPDKKLVQEEILADGRLRVASLRSEPLIFLGSRVRKRIFDLFFSSLVILFVLSWLVPVVALIIKLESRGPVFFRQQRSGKDNKPFWCYKFRSMKVNKNADKLQATKNDQRLTRFGAFMRKTSIDELPQFFNVLVGDMSIVGPRPHMLKHTEIYTKLIERYLVRQFLKPGITGWAQVNGFRGETKELSQMEHRVEHDIWYMENWSLMLDLRIVFMTIINVVKGDPEAY